MMSPPKIMSSICFCRATGSITPSAWGTYAPRATDICLFAGTGCFFLLLFLAFVRVLPFVPVAEVKELAREEAP